MVKAKKKAAPKRKPVPRHIDRLYKAVEHYIIKSGGNVIVIGGIQFIEWPGARAGAYSLVVNCVGRRPTFPPTTTSRPVAPHQQEKE